MLRIIVGNKRYSSWSLRGWLAVRHSGLPYDERMIPMWTAEYEAARAEGLLPSGKVPTLWDGDVPVWDSLAITDYLADKVGRDRYWPADPAARALARSMAAEMHSGFANLRQQCGMNLGRRYPGFAVSAETQADIDRIAALWTEARTRFGAAGDYLFGAFGAADIMFAPVVTRFVTYDVKLPPVAQAYVEAMLANPHMRDWKAAADAETIVLEKYEL
jgi:glutathione S-transferase